MAERKPPRLSLRDTYLDANCIRRQRSRGQMPMPVYTPEQHAAFICGNHPALDHAAVLAFERALVEWPGEQRYYLDFLEDNGVWERLNELEAT